MLHLVPLLTKTEPVWSISKAGGEEGSFADIYSLRSYGCVRCVRSATAYTHGDNDLVMKKLKVIAGASFRRKQQCTIGTVQPLDNRNRISLALKLSECLCLLFQVH